MKITRSIFSKTILVVIASCLVLIGFIFVSKFTPTEEFSNATVENIDGVQYISLKAGLGYSPNRISAKASVPTKLEIETNNTYDCTAFLDIPKLNIKKFLPPTGKTEIDLQSLNPGEELEGYCGSNTYKFVIKFS